MKKECFFRDRNLLMSLLLVLGALFIRAIYGEGYTLEDHLEYNSIASFWVPNFISDIFFNNKSNFMWTIRVLLLFCLLGLRLNFNVREKWTFLITLFLLFSYVFIYGQNILAWEVYIHFFIFFAVISLSVDKAEVGIKLAFATTYLLAGITKINPSWISGEIFSLKPSPQLFLIPYHSFWITLACNFLLLIELATPFLIFTKYRKYLAYYWIFFHLYSSFSLGYSFPTLMICLWIFNYDSFLKPVSIKSIKSVHLIAPIVILLTALYGILIPGSRSLTGEWKMSGLFMFDVNHRCKVNMKLTLDEGSYQIIHDVGYRDGIRMKNGSIIGKVRSLKTKFIPSGRSEDDFTFMDSMGVWRKNSEEIIYNPKLMDSFSGRTLCHPYLYYKYLKSINERLKPKELEFVMEKYLNGDPKGHRLMNLTLDSLNKIKFNHFYHNDWILLPKESDKLYSEYYWP